MRCRPRRCHAANPQSAYAVLPGMYEHLCCHPGRGRGAASPAGGPLPLFHALFGRPHGASSMRVCTRGHHANRVSPIHAVIAPLCSCTFTGSGAAVCCRAGGSSGAPSTTATAHAGRASGTRGPLRHARRCRCGMRVGAAVAQRRRTELPRCSAHVQGPPPRARVRRISRGPGRVRASSYTDACCARAVTARLTDSNGRVAPWTAALEPGVSAERISINPASFRYCRVRLHALACGTAPRGVERRAGVGAPFCNCAACGGSRVRRTRTGGKR